MAVRYTDDDIEQLLKERKPLPDDHRQRLKVRDKNRQMERQLDVIGEDGNEFCIILRQNKRNILDFSAVLAVRPPRSNQLFRLRRYNGKHSQHRNTIEGDRFYDFHIHMATERYQELGAHEETYAECSSRFANIDQALDCLLKDCGFDVPPDQQLPLFEEG